MARRKSNPALQAYGKPGTLPAPVRGWNARDSVAAMKAQDAIVLDDMFPEATKVSLRPGIADWSTGIASGARIESFLPYNGGTTKQLFAAAGTAFYNVTASGAVGAAVQTGLTNARWESMNFATSSGNWLIAANGFDKPRYWDGAAWVAVDAASVPAITGVTTTTLKEPSGHANRVWFIQKDSLIAWYLPVDSVGGAATAFPIRSYCTRGGTLLTMRNFSYDTNSGPQHYFAFFTTEGEVILFQGLDPATDFKLIGAYYIGQLLSNRCITKINGDIVSLTTQGLYRFSDLVQTDANTGAVALSDQIRNAVADATLAGRNLFGWEITPFFNGRVLMVNVPVTSTLSYQFAMNMSTDAWFRITKWSVGAFCEFNGLFYAGLAGKVCQAWTGYTDFGSDIQGVAITAYNGLGAPAQEKWATFARIYYNGTGLEQIYMALNVNYSTMAPSATVSSISASTATTWGTATWGGAVWPSDPAQRVGQQAVGAIGYQMALAVKVASKQLWSWYAADILYTVGGTIL
jgi:hypothetical protein